MGNVLLLSRKDVESVLEMKDTIEAMRSAFSQISDGSAVLPQRIVISTKKGLSLYMPAYLPKSKSLAVKVVDVDTGDVICIMDGGYLTAMRTGAVSGCAIDYLAKEKAETVGLFGTGVQGMTQLWAACVARPTIKKCKVYDIRKDVSEEFALEMSKKLNIEVEVADSAEETVKSADIILTATTSATPIFHGKWIRPGTHISGIGSHSPGTRELDGDTVLNSKVICDQISACLAEAGDLIIPLNDGIISKDHIYGELGDIISGKKPGRENDQEITLFKSVGLAVQDAATAKLVYETALKKKIGVNVEM
ncbi:MAG: ornithine cyclodeaminase family protein [Candidatus Hodarchaeales archaeon]